MIEMLADQIGVAIQRHYLHAQVVQNAELRREMDLAQRVQVAMIPQQAPEIPGLRAVGWSRPASVTGGDTYDLWRMEDGRLGLFLGDAAGHGIAPAIEVSQARTLVRTLSEINTDPTWLLERVNARLAADLEPGHFVTAFVGCMSPQGLLHWASAGHGPLFLRMGAGQPFKLLEPTAPPVGVLPQLMCDPTNTVVIDPGGALVVMSDGVFEARSPQDELFDVPRVLDLLNDHADDPPEQVLHRLRQAVELWQGREEPIDDQTITIVQRIA
jgi:serine phosphatase RsbU (regulator of sigma subunit)